MIMQLFDMTINGERVKAERTFEVINPALGKPFALVQEGEAKHVDQAVIAARSAFTAWSQTTERERSDMLQKLGALIEENLPELMQLVTLETGKPLKGLNGIGSRREAMGAVVWARATADLTLPVEVVQDDAEVRIEVHRKPIGVVGSITPWNWPLMITAWHIMPALQAGNTVVVKPSELAPTATIRLVELANSVLPPGVLNVVTGKGAVGEAIASHPGISKIVFTGSTRTGKAIMRSGASNLKRLTLELGGNDAGIVLPDVDPKKIAQRLFEVAFHNNGQTCACLKRLYVHETIYEALCEELANIALKTVVGDGLDDASELGPVQNNAQLIYVRSLVEEAKATGARILAGGTHRTGDGYFFAPTIVADATDTMRVVAEEQFGPVLPIIKYADVDDAITRANNSENGLGGSIWTNDIALALRLANRLECGSVWINDHGTVQPNAPFGGIKQSGFGVEFGQHGLVEFTTIQTVKTVKQQAST